MNAINSNNNLYAKCAAEQLKYKIHPRTHA